MSSRHRWDRICFDYMKCSKCSARIEYIERDSRQSHCATAINKYFVHPGGERILMVKGVKIPPCTGGENEQA